MKKALSIFVSLAVVAIAVGASMILFTRDENLTSKLAKLNSGVKRLDPTPPNALSVTLWGANKSELDGIHCAAICDVGSSRLVFLKKDPIDDSVSFGLDLPIAGDTPQTGREWGGNFTYSYDDGATKCEFFGMPFRISSQGVVQIGGESPHLYSQKLIVVSPENKVIENRRLGRDLGAR